MHGCGSHGPFPQGSYRMYTYQTSKYVLARQTRRLMLVLLLLGLPVCFVFSVIALQWSIQDASVSCIGGSLLSWVVVYIASRGETDEIALLIGEESIVYRGGDHETTLPWKAIARVAIVERPPGVPVRITLHTADLGTLALLVYGFEDPRGIVDRIKDRLPDDAIVVRRRWLLNWRNPFVLAAVCWPIACTVLYVVAKLMERFLR